MPRTIRTKVYQFSELSDQSKLIALETERKNFRLSIGNDLPITSDMTLEIYNETVKRIEANEYEFKQDGTRF